MADTTEKSIHKTVLLNEAIEGLNLKNDSIVVDGTFGGGGHSREICERYKKAKIIAIDQDAGALERGKEVFKNLECNITFHNSNFRDLEKVLKSEGVEEADGMILDLGLSSDQLDNSGRGFSFMKDERLLMTMKENPRPEDLTAEDVVNSWSEENLANIIYGYGEEKFSRKIAKGIVDARKREEIKTTFDLVRIIENSVPNGYKKGRIHFATKTFQAIRIAVNDELGALQAGIASGFDVLKKGGRMSVISFHSLEDRVVKRFFKELEKDGKGKLINKKPVTAKDEEIINNRRSRSAKLRVIEKI